MAFDGTNYLVAWRDGRVEGGAGGGDIYAARVTPDGAVLDPDGVPVFVGQGTQRDPTIGFDGTNYLVAWTNLWADVDVYGTRVSPAGAVLDPESIRIAAGPGVQEEEPAVASDGDNYLVVFGRAGSGASYDLYGTRVSPDGVVVDSEGIPISTQAGNQFRPNLAFDGTNYLVVWDDARSGDIDLYGARVSSGGSVLDPGGFPVSSEPDTQDQVALAFDGTNYVVVWQDFRSSSEHDDVYGARVSPAGEVLDPSGISLVGAVNPEAAPAIGFDGTNYLVVWDDTRRDQAPDLYGARVSQSGQLLDGSGFEIASANDERAPTVAFNGTNYLVTWEEDHVFSGEHSVWISAARVSPQGEVLDPGGFTVSNQAWYQFRPFVASDGADFLVAWARSPDRSGVARDVWSARVSAGGVVLDPNAILICQVPGNEDPSAVSFDGTNYLVVWDDQRSGNHIFGARVSPAGSVLDPGGLPISSMSGSQDLAAAAFDGTNYLLAWQE